MRRAATNRYLFGLALAGAATAARPAAPVEVACPPVVATTQALVAPVAGWQPFAPARYGEGHEQEARVSGVDLFDGPPEERAQLKPEDDTGAWTFARPAPPARPIYLVCGYTDTRLRLARSLPLTVRRCQETRPGVLRCDTFPP